MIALSVTRVARRWVAVLAGLGGIGSSLVAAPPAAAAITPAVGVFLMAAHSNKCLNVYGASTANDAPIIQYACIATAANERWRAVPWGDGSYRIIVEHSGKCLNVPGSNLNNNIQLIQYTCTTAGAKNERWRPHPVPGTTRFTLTAEHSGKCMNVSGASTADSAKVIQYTCTAGALNEQWYFPPATATQPAVPVEQYSRTSAMQASPVPGAAVGTLEYAYTDNIGRLLHGHQVDPDNFGSVQWTVISGNEAFSGQPVLTEVSDGRVQVAAHNSDSDLWMRTQTAKTATFTWGSWSDVGGSTSRHATFGRLGTANPDVFTVDTTGRLWHLTEDGKNAPFMGWRYVGGSGLVGTPTVAPTRDGLQVFALDTTGALQTGVWRSGALSDWTSLGGSGLTGSPAAVVYPGYKIRLFARAADGTILTKQQDDLGVFPQTWDPVGTLVAAGSPAALLDPVTGRTEVVARGTDGAIYSTGETAQASGTWRDWKNVLTGGDVAATDPTVLTYTGATGPSWAFLFRDPNNQHRVYTAGSTLSLAATAQSPAPPSRSFLPSSPSFVARSSPAPPR